MVHAADPPSPAPLADPDAGTIADVFRAIVAEHPDRLAYEDRDGSVTYRELDAWSNRIAHRLLALDDDRPLVIVAPLRIASLALLLGGVKAGRLVVPLDARWPEEQWLEVTRRTHGHLVVPDDETRRRVADRTTADVFVPRDLVGDDPSDPLLTLDPHAPTFVFFTSGSTGAPKGTLVGHVMAMNNAKLFDATVDDRKALIAPLSFITGTLGALASVMTGGSGHCFDLTSEDFASLPAWLDDHRITVMSLSVTLIAMIAKAANDEGRTIESMRYVAHGGEAATARHFADAHRAFPNATFRHGFGMTEIGAATRFVFDKTVELPTEGLVPPGHPWPWVDITIVDDDGRPLPDGESGEIWVTGDQVAFGYWDEPALTAERFIAHPDGTRTVRTGDRGRFRPDGMLEHLGRLDRRIKVHGQLVDLALVERELEQLERVDDAVVSAVPTDDGTHRVVAHVVLDSGPPVTVGELRRGLADRLPPYAIPRAFFRVDDVRQTTTGKVDRAWLRESTVGALPLETEYVAPRDEGELAVARLFEDVLAVPQVGVHDDFFELGGDSLSVVELLAGLSDEFGLELSASDLLGHATVERVAARLDDGTGVTGRVVVRVNDASGRPLFCVPGAGDTPLQYRALGRRLRDVAVYSFEYRGIAQRAVPDQTVVAIARRNVRAMRAVDPVGPYRLLGYSFGGVVAMAMARQLVNAGHTVELLALLEPSLRVARDSRTARTRALAGRVHGRSVAAIPGNGMQARTARALRVTRAGIRVARHHVDVSTAGLVRRTGVPQHEVFLHLHTRMLRVHRPKAYRGRTVVLASSQYLDQTATVLDRLLPAERNGGRRRELVVAGEHLDLVREPNVADVARGLDALLADDRS